MVFQNGAAALTFNPSAGTFSIHAKSGNRSSIRDAVWSVLDWRSDQMGESAVSSARFSDALGSGVQVDVRTPGKDAVLLMQARIYDEIGGIALRCGLVNKTGAAIQVTDMHVLHADGESGYASLGADVGAHHRMLTGEGGFSYAHLLDGVAGKTLNVMTWVYLNKPESSALLAGSLTTYEFQTEITSEKAEARADGFALTVRMFDATGKRVDDGCVFYGDWVWVDVANDAPYRAQRQYAKNMAKAMNVQLHNYNDYISVCLWYVFAFSCGDRSANTSLGAVQEAEAMNASGITRYAPAMVRLVPDEYVNPNEQLWWDEKHWQQYIHLTPPYETLDKWIAKMTELGAIGGLYMQPTFRSDDYCALHPEHMLFNREENEADYTDQDFLRHMQDVYTRIREAGVRAMFYDYTMLVRGDIRRDENSLLRPGGFEDPYATNVSAYRNIFRIAKDTAGAELMITENTWNYSGQELATGVIDAQRSKMDNVGMNREVVKSSVRQWYRNKTTKLIDPDVKNFTTTDSDIRRKEVSLMGLLFGKTMLGSSISRYDAASIRDIGRILPMPLDGQTAVPVDLFLSDENGNAAVYEYTLPGDEHIVALLNEKHHQRTFRVALGEKQTFGGIGLKADTTYDIWDFWNECYIGRMTGNVVLEQTLRRNECRVMAIRPVREALHVLSTNRHILQGVIETETLQATAADMLLRVKIIGGDPMQVVLALPAEQMQVASCQCFTENVTCWAEKDPFAPIALVHLSAEENTEALVQLRMQTAAENPAEAPILCGGLQAAVDDKRGCVNLQWPAKAGLRYRISKDGVFIGTVRTGAFTDASAEEESCITYTIVPENTVHELGEAVSCTVDTGRYLPSLHYGMGGDAAQYGHEGCVLFNIGGGGQDYTNLPDYVQDVTVENRHNYSFPAKVGDARTIPNPADGTRALGMVCDDKTLNMTIRFRDRKTHTVTLYSVDCNRAGRTMDIAVMDAQGNVIVPKRNIPEYGEGVHIAFEGAGEMHIALENHAVNAVLSAVYFDKARG